MTFLANETSQAGGAPVEVYEFLQGGDTFRFADSEDDQVVGANTYTAAVIDRTTITIGPEQRSTVIQITVPATNDFAQRYIGVQPGNRASLTITRFHRFDTPTPEIEVIFKGQVRSVAFTNQGLTAQIAVMPLTVALSRSIPRRGFANLCNHVLYDTRCKVLESSFKFVVTPTVLSSDGQTITVPGLDASKGVGWAKGGFIEMPSLSDFRLILNHTATDQIKILLPFRTSPIGLTVNILAGCDHSIQICKSKFNNVINYGGHAFVPDRNIFQTGVD